MENYYIYAKDFSGSTGGNSYYHSNGMRTLNQFKEDVKRLEKENMATGNSAVSKIIYLHWGDRCYEVDEEETIISYQELECDCMGTEPDMIIRWIQSKKMKKIRLLYIITDGLIDSSSAKKCFELNENMVYETFVFHAFNKDLNQIDLSVAASFLKNVCIIYRNNELFDDVNISEEYDYDEINIYNFTVKKDNIKSYIKLKYINKFKNNAHALQEIDKLKKLRNRLFIELEKKTQLTLNNKVDLDTKDKNVFLNKFLNTEWYKSLLAPSQIQKVEIEKSISSLINYIVSDTKSFLFDALKFDTNFDDPVEEEPILDVNFTAEEEIEFPDVILYDNKGVPVILLVKLNLLDKIIFHITKEAATVSHASFNKFKTAMDCPLFLLDDPDISESIGYFYTLNVYKQLLSSSTNIEPYTRRPFHGGLVLTDTDEFDKYNDYILSATYFDSRKVHYNVGLFYFVLWKNCESKKWMDRNVADRFKKYVMRRISETKCKIGLSSLPLDPPEITSLPTALWYCVELSSIIFKTDPVHFTQERLRMYAGVAHSMIEILRYFGYDLELETIEKRIDLIRHVTILKRIPKYGEKVYYLLERIFKNIDGFLVSEVDKPYNICKLNHLKCDHKGMLSDSVIEDKVNLNDFVHFMHFVDISTAPKDGKGPFEICEKTYRPFFSIDEHNSFYGELVKITKKVVINNENNDKININYEEIDSLEFNRILSLFNLFINCVKSLKQYPSLSEYKQYISKKKKYSEDLVTIYPTNVITSIENAYSSYQSVMKKVDVKKFIEVSKNYVQRSERIKAEEVVKFNKDYEVKKYISSEELKVKLKQFGPVHVELGWKGLRGYQLKFHY